MYKFTSGNIGSTFNTIENLVYNKSYASLLYILIALINKCINNASYVNVVGINSFNIFILSLYNPVPNLLL